VHDNIEFSKVLNLGIIGKVSTDKRSSNSEEIIKNILFSISNEISFLNIIELTCAKKSSLYSMHGFRLNGSPNVVAITLSEFYEFQNLKPAISVAYSVSDLETSIEYYTASPTI
jgi:hypothetical protein